MLGCITSGVLEELEHRKSVLNQIGIESNQIFSLTMEILKIGLTQIKK
jgi:hypothetical protein